MAFPIGSIPLTGSIGTTASTDTFATHIDTLGQGGYRSVASTTDRNNITADRRSFGMMVTVNSTYPAVTYMLANASMGGADNVLTNNANWISFNNNTYLYNQIFSATSDFTPGTSTTVTITSIPLPATSANILFIDFDGVIQHSDQYSYSAGVVTFTSVIPAYVNNIQVSWGSVQSSSGQIRIYATYAAFSADAAGTTKFFALITDDELSGNGQQAYSYDGNGGIYWFASTRVN